MTRQESFKRRVRARMEKTGEKYGAARRVLIEQTNDRPRPEWESPPETSNEALTGATGRGWNEWREIIDHWGGRQSEHGPMVEYLTREHRVDGWWAQTIAVGYERITGLRLPYQQPDGTFTAGKTKTVSVNADELRAMLYDDGSRADLFPGLETELRSSPTTKVPRIGIGPGVAQIAIQPKDDGRVTVTIAHEKLPAPESVDDWKRYWSEWLDAIDES